MMALFNMKPPIIQARYPLSFLISFLNILKIINPTIQYKANRITITIKLSTSDSNLVFIS